MIKPLYSLCALVVLGISACTSGLVSPEKQAEADERACLAEGLAKGTPEFNTCLYRHEQSARADMRRTEKTIERKMRDQRQLQEDYRSRQRAF